MEKRGPYKMRTIARLTGFSPALLRAWERRHGLLEPIRSAGGHRLYTDDDLKVLRRIKDLAALGRSIGEIASGGRGALLDQAETRRPALAPMPVERPDPAARQELALWRERIVEAAVKLDSTGIRRALDEAFARVSAEIAVTEVIEPTAREIGELWSAGKCTVASEHMASGLFIHRLNKLVESAEGSGAEWPTVMVTCFPDEFHQLGALVIAYFLTRRGARVTYLGAAVPLEDLEEACDLMEPNAVLMSVTRPEIYRIHRRGLMGALKRRRDRENFYLGGQGVVGDDPALREAGGRFIASRNAPACVDEVLADLSRHRRPTRRLSL